MILSCYNDTCIPFWYHVYSNLLTYTVHIIIMYVQCTYILYMLLTECVLMDVSAVGGCQSEGVVWGQSAGASPCHSRPEQDYVQATGMHTSAVYIILYIFVSKKNYCRSLSPRKIKQHSRKKYCNILSFHFYCFLLLFLPFLLLLCLLLLLLLLLLLQASSREVREMWASEVRRLLTGQFDLLKGKPQHKLYHYMYVHVWYMYILITCNSAILTQFGIVFTREWTLSSY